MELTIALSISPKDLDSDIAETLDSLPWDCSGVDLVVYSEDSAKIKRIIQEEDLERTLINGQINTLFCEESYSSIDTYEKIAVEDCKTDLITFLTPGDTIEFFDSDLLYGEIKDLGLGNTSGDYPVASTCYESRMLPVSEKGMVFSIDFLRNNNLTPGDDFIPRLVNVLIADLESPEYTDSWGKYSIDELFSVSPKTSTPLENERKIPKVYEDLWKNRKVDYNFYLRDLMWTRMSRAAGVILASYHGRESIVSEFYKYLLPENKASILD